jgi:hypothetical protein
VGTTPLEPEIEEDAIKSLTGGFVLPAIVDFSPRVMVETKRIVIVDVLNKTLAAWQTSETVKLEVWADAKRDVVALVSFPTFVLIVTAAIDGVGEIVEFLALVLVVSTAIDEVGETPVAIQAHAEEIREGSARH